MALPGVSLAGSCPAISQLADFIAGSGIPGLVVTSAKRSEGGGSFHDKGQALDVGGSPQAMCALTKLMNGSTSSLAELIHNDPSCNGSVKNGKTADVSIWGASTWAQHTNHVHIAVPDCNTWSPGSGATLLASSSSNPLSGLTDALANFGKFFDALTNTTTWRNLGELVVGLVLVLGGVVVLRDATRSPESQATIPKLAELAPLLAAA